MRSPTNRIADLEARITMPAARRVYAVVGGPVAGSPADFIRASGLPVNEATDLIIHRVLVAPSPTGPVQVAAPWSWAGTQPEGIAA